MSFTRTLAKLAAAFAVVKGVQKFRQMGGVSGLQTAMKDNPALAGMQTQMATMMERLGMTGAAAGNRGNADAAASGLGGMLSALGAASAAGSEQIARMMDGMTGTTAVSAGMEDNARLMIRAMVQAAKADGEIDPEERARIMEHLGDIDAEERAFVEAEMARPVDVQALAADTGDQMKAQVYAMSVMAIRVDSSAERNYLDGLAAALGLSEEARNRVHASVGLTT